MALNVTISLDGLAPVTVRDTEWPLIASVRRNDTGRTYAYVKVRREVAGTRAIVYGIRSRDGLQERHGRIAIDSSDVVAAIHSIAGRVGIEAARVLNSLPPVAL